MKTVPGNIFIAIDADGDFEVGKTQDSAISRYADEVNEGACHLTVIKLALPLPTPTVIDVVVSGDAEIPTPTLNMTMTIEPTKE